MNSTHKQVLDKARRVKNDEFFTLFEDVEKEIEMYPAEMWDNKSVLCNCNDYIGKDRTEKDTSAFALYFLRNFHRLHLKKLVCTMRSNGRVFVKTKGKELINCSKDYDGDFAHPYSLRLLHEADIVCTNPPFSLARKFWKILIESRKKFLIISNVANSITTAYIPYFKDHKVWPGHNRVDKFLTPKGKEAGAPGHWYTNLKITYRPKWKHLKLVPLENIPENCIRRDDNFILAFDKGFVPTDYPHSFSVSSRIILNGVLEKGYEIVQEKQYVPYFKGKRAFARVLIQKINNASIKEVA